jgi:malonyl-CoA/methylmalonyl-CoA synthetase
MSSNLYAVFQRHFPKELSSPFIIESSGVALSYADVESRSAQVANLLQSLGIRPGDRVAAQTEKSAAALILYLGCLRAGAVYLPLNTAYTDEELLYFLTDAKPALFVCDATREKNLTASAHKIVPSNCLNLDKYGEGSFAQHALAHDTRFETVALEPADPAAILYSSGTTGKPKGATLSHGALAANAAALHSVWQFGPDDVLLHALPIFHTHGLFVATNTVLMNGTSMIFHTGFDCDAVIADLPNATVFMGVPTYYTRLLTSAALTQDACTSIRLFISGSAPLLDETFSAFTARTGHTIVERYGMTEAGIITSANPDKPRRAGTVGWPLDGVTLRIMNDDEEPVGESETGGLQIKGSSLFSGYWNNPEKTAEEFTSDRFFRTGDIARYDPDGQITLVGRAKDMYISGGFNVFPKEIEQIVDAIEGVEECAVVGLPHPDFGEAGLAIIVAENRMLDEAAIRLTLKETLANYKVPKRIVQADSLPRNAMGKVQKNLLRETYGDEWRKWLQDQ